jgi:dCMP deaminase
MNIDSIARWDAHFMELCDVIAKKSKDTSTKVGCLIVGPDNEIRGNGYNGMPRGIDDNILDRHERPTKYKWFEHAERNAIYNCARVGIATKGCRLYVNSMPPCADCARAIIQSGIAEVVLTTLAYPARWADSCETALDMLAEAGIKVRTVGR